MNEEIIQENQTTTETNTTDSTSQVPLLDNTSSVQATQSIIVDGQALDWYVEMYREAKIQNFLLMTILIVIPSLWAVNKIYSGVRSMLTVKF